MGCFQSKSGDVQNQSAHPTLVSRHSSKGPLSQNDIAARLDGSQTTQSLDFSSYKIRYAYLSQRGYYPDSLDKPNQDTFCVHTNFLGDNNSAYFAIFDGHGKEGHFCAQYARDKLPGKLRELIAGQTSIRESMTKGHIDVNTDLHASDVDDSLSGTTAISMLLKDKSMYIANVGDSRAILCQRIVDVNNPSSFKLKAKPLSFDQTPYRKDERDRVKQYGARILSMDQIEGIEPVHENWGDVTLGEELDEGGDPPRIWSPHGEYPGTAFTRSIGDAVAEELGVTADPELSERDVHPHDAFVVIASDGVFEFLTNQAVADLVLKNFNDPVAACHAIVNESYELWLQYEVRTDDITVILIFLDEVKHSSVRASVNINLDDVRMTGLKPVRRVLSREKKRSLMILDKDDDEEDDDDDDNGTNNMNDQSSDASSNNIPRPSEERRVASASTPDVSTESGWRASFRKIGSSSKLMRGPSWRRNSAKQGKSIDSSQSNEDVSQILSSIQNLFLFSHLTMQQKEQAARSMGRLEPKSGDVIIHQGDLGDRFYVIERGEFEVRVKKENTSTVPPSPIGSSPSSRLGDVVHVYSCQADATNHPSFGELALMYSTPRAASVIATTDGVLWTLDRALFKTIVQRSTSRRRSALRSLRRVDLLKSLNIHHLQRLCDILTESTYRVGEVILSQGNDNDSFFVIRKGTVKCVVTDANTGSERTLMSLGPGEYFGERALLGPEIRSCSCLVTSKRVKCFSVNRLVFNDQLGPLQSIMDDDRRRRESKVYVGDVNTPMNIESVVGVSLSRLDDVGFSSIVSLPTIGQSGPRLGTMTTFHKVELIKSNLVLNTIHLKDSLRFIGEELPCLGHPLVPILLKTYNFDGGLHMLTLPPLVTDLSSLLCDVLANVPAGMTCGLPEAQVRHVMSGVICGLEKLHNKTGSSGIVFRNCHPDAIYLTPEGQPVLFDFKFARIGSISENSYTLCGVAQYLSPEQITRRGHNSSVDFWAIGVLMYELLTGKTPFDLSSDAIKRRTLSNESKSQAQLPQSADDPLVICSRITAFKKGDLIYPANFYTSAVISRESNDLLHQLIEPDQRSRLQDFALIRSHPWLSDIDWLAVERGDLHSVGSEEMANVVKQRFVEAAAIGVNIPAMTKRFAGDDGIFDSFY